MVDKRERQRVVYNAEARIVYNGETASGPIKDLSLKGIFINTDTDLDIGTDVTVELHLSGTTTDLSLRINGCVERSTEQGIGVKFKEMELDSYTHLKNIVSYAESAMVDIK